MLNKRLLLYSMAHPYAHFICECKFFEVLCNSLNEGRKLFSPKMRSGAELTLGTTLVAQWQACIGYLLYGSIVSSTWSFAQTFRLSRRINTYTREEGQLSVGRKLNLENSPELIRNGGKPIPTAR